MHHHHHHHHQPSKKKKSTVSADIKGQLEGPQARTTPSLLHSVFVPGLACLVVRPFLAGRHSSPSVRIYTIRKNRVLILKKCKQQASKIRGEEAFGLVGCNRIQSDRGIRSGDRWRWTGQIRGEHIMTCRQHVRSFQIEKKSRKSERLKPHTVALY